ncbi:MAG: chemotaxis protein MotB [Planctomycetota bacterium]|jgi:chemotaxis protein MotB
MEHLEKPTAMKFNALVMLALLPLLGSCASQKVLDDYEAELGALREERTALQRENTSLQDQLNQTQMVLSSTSGELESARAVVATAPTLPTFDNGVEVGMRGGNLVIMIPSSISFGSGKSTLSNTGKSALEEVAALLRREHPNGQYWIEGHTDNDQISKSKYASNRVLSNSRAMSVLEYFVASCGIADSSCVVVGHGEYSPVTGNDSKDGKARNRRVEIVVHE